MRLSITAPLISAALIATALCPVVNAQEVNATATDIDTRHANEAASPTGPLPVIHVDDSMPPAVTAPPEDSQSIPEVIVTASSREQSNQDETGSASCRERG